MRKRRPSRKRKNSLLNCLLASLAGGGAVYADTPVGLIGGETGGGILYAAFVSSDGTLTPISGLSDDGPINGVAINELGFGLIGGEGSTAGYAALLSPGGGLTPLSLSVATGHIQSTAINQSGNGLIGGKNLVGPQYGYAATIAPDGTVTALTLPLDNSSDIINFVALNDAGVGLIGGEGGLVPYAAQIINEVPTALTNIPMGGAGEIYSVAINDLGNGIIGGTANGDVAYGAFVTSGGVASSVFSGIPTGGGGLTSVAINSSGVGLVGGQDASNNAFAGYATATMGGGTVTPLFESPFSGAIYSVAMNDSGTGLIGGDNNSNAYAALVQLDGSINAFLPGLVGGQINSVAINQAGVGLIGGIQNSLGYAALVAPNGTLTPLNVSSESEIESVALNNWTDGATPQSVGPYFGAVYTQLAAASALELRFLQQNRIWNQTESAQVASALQNSEMHLASNEPDLALNLKLAKNKSATPPKNNSIWVAPFGNYTHLSADRALPSYNNEIGGALLGYDYSGSNYLVGGSLGYAFNYISYSESLGHGKLQEEMANVYGSYYRDHFWIGAVVWGGLHQFWNTRDTLAIITSKSLAHGWILSPHLEMASPWAIDQRKRYFVEPFFTLDWVNSWQGSYTETGEAGFNLKMKSVYGSLLQSEAGVRFYERFEYGWGTFCLEEKVSYVNQAPFGFNPSTTSFVASASTFPIAVASTTVENLGAFQLFGSFFPRNRSYPFGGFSFQVTANSSYQSYFGTVFTGVNF